ncbi:MAG: acetate--CoA ligase family protein [Prosthecochloris sp.]|uniref:ATP-grasp domain protein n=1 Tax=Prosthecochloris aestuarii (strain DSM 271 / SK 413) TaxID=290512 RepID=B4S7T7_PROA2|nr:MULTISPECIES: ATP citrate lyase citrate-binding domain-containing protein [Prosthecochloris]ACF46124.1 ATP-grasp domain protein [Prosthecochloris aestuarii DSM 271]MCW8798290.1 acetate--CoA ligase family protein [Prosthecochloris sp.]NEX12742.1 ATP citrate lyase [Prosthecochloris sp.]
MAKILEGSAMKFFNKWGIPVPNYVVVMDPNRLAQLGEANKWLRESKLVVKAHEAIGGRFKLGLVKLGLNLEEAVEASREMIGRKIGTAEIRQVIVAEMLDHDEEYYVSIAGNPDGAELLLSSKGGVDIEDNWDTVQRIHIPIDETPSLEALTDLATKAGFGDQEIAERVAKIASRLILCYDNEDAQSIEINPLVIRKSDMRFAALDAVMNVDWDARFRHPDWDFKPVSEIGRPFTEAEQQIMDIDSRIKGSVKFVEVPGGEVALLTAGGGASVFYADAVVARGGSIANYAEYSGAPPDWAVEALTETLCQLPNIKHIIVGGAIANFTDVKATFGGIINGLRESKANGYLDGVKIWVRRGGPNESEGLAAISKLKDEGFDIHVYDRNIPMTDIVDMAMNV